jgi:hypothetical protein
MLSLTGIWGSQAGEVADPWVPRTAKIGQQEGPLCGRYALGCLPCNPHFYSGLCASYIFAQSCDWETGEPSIPVVHPPGYIDWSKRKSHDSR